MSWEEFCKVNEVGSRFRNALISDFISREEVYQQAIEWCKKPQSMVITGPAGRGKTHYCYALFREAMIRWGWEHLRWIRSKELDDKLTKQTRDYGDAGYILEQFFHPPILFIDDFGVDKSSEKSERDYYDLIDRRWAHEKITIISTNLQSEQIEKVYGSRIHSRLKDSLWLIFDWNDLRGSTSP